MGCCCTISPWKNGCYVWPSLHHRSSSAFAGARTRSNNTAEMSAMIEALFFLGPHGPVACDANSCIFDDSKHAAGICLGTIQARTHAQLALACQQSLLKVQHRRPMQHVYGHTGIWEMSVRIIPLRLVLSGLCQIIISLYTWSTSFF